LSVASPATWPKSQLSGRGLGQQGSTSNSGRESVLSPATFVSGVLPQDEIKRIMAVIRQ